MIKYSATKLNTYKMCPYRYYLTYIKKTPVPQVDAFVFGDAVHKVLQDFQNWAKMNKNVNEYHKKAKEITEQRMKLISNDIMYNIGITYPYVYSNYIKEYIDFFIEKRIYEKSYETEKTLQVMLGDICLVGAIDLFIVPDVIIDFKTSKYIPSINKLIDEYQTRIYSLVVPQEINMMYIYLRKPLKVRSMIISTPNDIIKRDIIQYIKLIEQSKQWYKKYDACKLCPFIKTCRTQKDDQSNDNLLLV